VQRRPGTLTRITSLLDRRGFVTDAVAQWPTWHPDLERIVIVLSADGTSAQQAARQVGKQVAVLAVAVEPGPEGRSPSLTESNGRSGLTTVFAALQRSWARDAPADALLTAHPVGQPAPEPI
jgi:acetolactate synthase regulatory subunit